MKKILLLLVVSSGFIANAQTGDIPFQPGATSLSMGGVQTAITGPWATHTNPGLLAFSENLQVAIGTENRFLLPELNSHGLAGVFPLKTGVTGLGITSFGYRQYRRSRIGAGYGLLLGESISAGVTVHYDMLTIGNNYGSADALSATAGFAAKVSKQFTIGAYVFNPFRVRFSDAVDEYVPTILSIGGAYEFSQKVLFSADVEKDINLKPGLKAGLQYRPNDVFYIRAGFRTLPQSYTFGFGADISNLQVNIAAWMHPVLGVSPALSLQYEVK